MFTSFWRTACEYHMIQKVWAWALSPAWQPPQSGMQFPRGPLSAFRIHTTVHPPPLVWGMEIIWFRRPEPEGFQVFLARNTQSQQSGPGAQYYTSNRMSFFTKASLPTRAVHSSQIATLGLRLLDVWGYPMTRISSQARAIRIILSLSLWPYLGSQGGNLGLFSAFVFCLFLHAF